LVAVAVAVSVASCDGSNPKSVAHQAVSCEAAADDVLVVDGPLHDGARFDAQYRVPTVRGLGWRLDRQTDRSSWQLVAYLKPAYGGEQPAALRPNDSRVGWNDIAVSSPDPDRFVLPNKLASGCYRVCAENAPPPTTSLCATFAVE
jgi:hypothetical protein